MKRLLTLAAAIALAVGAAACEPKMVNPEAAPTQTGAPTVAPIETKSPEPAPVVTTEPPPPPKPLCKQGAHQAEVETALIKLGFGPITADGVQTDADCAAIKKFQKRFVLQSQDGVAGPATHNVAKRLAASDPAKCNAGPELTACIDLTNQTTWLMQGGKVIHGPTVTRTGFNHPDGHGAPTPSGNYKIIERQTKNWTETFKVYLNYWQRIMGNNGFHETTSNIHDMSAGSHGCVNLLKEDAVAYWNTLKMGTPVRIFGRRPGT